MPLMKLHVFQHSWSLLQQGAMLDVVHEVMVDAFGVRQEDRYQILTEHSEHRMQALDTGLGFQRTSRFLLLEIVSRPRPKEQKVTFYRNLCSALFAKCQLAPTDLMISFVANNDEDWSFGNGEAQFLTGAL